MVGEGFGRLESEGNTACWQKLVEVEIWKVLGFRAGLGNNRENYSCVFEATGLKFEIFNAMCTTASTFLKLMVVGFFIPTKLTGTYEYAPLKQAIHTFLQSKVTYPQAEHFMPLPLQTKSGKHSSHCTELLRLFLTQKTEQTLDDLS